MPSKPVLTASLLAVGLGGLAFPLDVVFAQRDSTPEELQPKQLIVADEDFERAAKQLRDRGGRVRSFHPRSSTENWVQIILDASELKSPADDETMAAVKLLSTDSDTHFHARGCEFSADGLAQLAGTKISRLELTGANITDAHIKAIKGLAHLVDLSLTETTISAAGFAAIADCQQLTSIGLARNSDLGDSSLAILSRLPKLMSVSLHRSLTKDAAAELNKIGPWRSSIRSPKHANFPRGQRSIQRPLGRRPITYIRFGGSI